MARRPLERLHPAHRAAHRAQQLVDAEMVDQRELDAHHVADGHHRETQAVTVCPSPGLVLAGPVEP